MSIRVRPMQSIPTRRLAQITRHSSYFLTRGDLYILCERVMFRVHSYFFERESILYQERLRLAERNPLLWTGQTSARPYVVQSTDITAEDVSHFLWVFYNPAYSLYNTASLSTWASILKCARYWNFPQVIDLVDREVAKIRPVVEIKTDDEAPESSDALSYKSDKGPNITDDRSQPITRQSTPPIQIPFHNNSDKYPGIIYNDPNCYYPPDQPGIRLRHPDHPFGVDQNGLPYFLGNTTDRIIGF